MTSFCEFIYETVCVCVCVYGGALKRWLHMFVVFQEKRFSVVGVCECVCVHTAQHIPQALLITICRFTPCIRAHAAWPHYGRACDALVTRSRHARLPLLFLFCVVFYLCMCMSPSHLHTHTNTNSLSLSGSHTHTHTHFVLCMHTRFFLSPKILFPL